MKDNTYPILASITKNGKTKEWKIWVTGTEKLATIKVLSGFQDGKQTSYDTIIDKGKNLNKKNETTPFEQAVKEAQSKWNKKIDSGYHELDNGKPELPIILPMLALRYQERGDDMIFPCYVQPKIDGIHGLYQNDFIFNEKNNEWDIQKSRSFYSRKKNRFPHLDHITDELEKVKLTLKIDGELYSDISTTSKPTERQSIQDNITLSHQELNGLTRKVELTKNDSERIKHIIFLVFDIAIPNMTFKERHALLKEYFSNNTFKYVKLLETSECKTREEVEKFMNKYVSLGFEGLMLRNKDGLYIPNYRSSDLQKYKRFQDAEFKIVGFTESDKSTEKGAIKWICETKKHKQFTVRPKGSLPERRKLFKNGNKYIGMYLKVVFFDYTDDGIPFHLSTMYGGEADIRSLEI